MDRRESLCLLASIGCLSGSGCLESVFGSSGVIIDAVELRNTTGVPVDMTVDITDAGETVFSETVTVLGDYDTRTHVVIPAPVDEPGQYTVTARHDGHLTEVDAAGFSRGSRYVSVRFRVEDDGRISRSVGTDDEPDHYRE